jgi:indole-3-glycerol phosphate synthase
VSGAAARVRAQRVVAAMRDFLRRMAESSAARAAAARAQEPEAALLRRALATPPAPALRLEEFDLIAELKLRSPSAGRLAPADAEATLEARALAYAGGGAAALSVLTEPDAFDGALDHLARVARAVPVPVMRKDFLVEPYQVLEARAAGASGVLVVLRILDDARARELLDAARATGMFALLEAFDEEDAARAAALAGGRSDARAALLVGLNTRDLDTLATDPARLAALADRLPRGLLRVAESGIATGDAVRRAVRDGYRLALVGEALMRAGDPGAAVAELVAAGRDEAAALDLEEPARPTAAAPARPRLGVKICGVRDAGTLRAAAEAGADAVGFVFAPSPRQVGIEAAARLARQCPPQLERVGVFAAEVPAFALELVRCGVIHTVQADAAALERLGDDLPATRRLPVLHDGAGVGEEAEALLERAGGARLLFEGRASGSGLVPDWDRAARLARRARLVLAGGLSPANVAEAVRRVRPAMVDVSSGVESGPGVKDARRIHAFVEHARAAHAALGKESA